MRISDWSSDVCSSDLYLVLNKVDLTRKDKLLTIATEINARVAFDETFFIAASNGDGVPELKAHLAALMPEGPWHFPEDEVSDAPERMLAAEITREQLYRQLHEELRSEEHTSELQSLMRISYAVF